MSLTKTDVFRVIKETTLAYCIIVLMLAVGMALFSAAYLSFFWCVDCSHPFIAVTIWAMAAFYIFLVGVGLLMEFDK